MIKKQMRIFAICFSAAIVLGIGYLVFLKPFLDNMNTTEINTDLAIFEGESVLYNDRILITPQVERSGMSEVFVKNKVDEYRVIHNLEVDKFYLEGSEFAPINPETLPNLIVNAGYLLSIQRVAAKGIEGDDEYLDALDQYGLTEEYDPSYFIVTKTDGTWYKIIVGDKIPTTGGYYVMYEDDSGVRPAIYIIDTMLESTILNAKSSILMPYIIEPISNENLLFVDDFKIYHEGELFIDIYLAEIPEGSDALANPQIRYPAPYNPSGRYSEMVQVFQNFMGDSVVESVINEESLEKYGFYDGLGHRIMFKCGGKDYDLLFSKKTEDGKYYVISRDFYTIVEISASAVPFLEWDLLRFIDKPIFMRNINEVESIEIINNDESTLFTLEGLNTDLVVNYGDKSLDVANFRKYYMSILSIDILDYEKNPETDAMLQMIITMRNGQVLDYKFYFASTRRCYVSLNGDGQFYVTREKVLKLMTDTTLVIQDLPIDADAPE